MSEAISIRSLTRRFERVTALDGLSLKIKPGRIVGLLGINGAGKTTLMRILNGTLYGDAGEVEIAGISQERFPEQARQQVGYLGEVPALYDGMTVWAYLLFMGGLKGLGRQAAKAATHALSTEFDLTPRWETKLESLSRGYRQRVGLAAALMGDPPILLLDEPSTGLDPKQIKVFHEKLRSRRGRQTIVFSSHILSEVESLCDEVRLLHGGRLRASFVRSHRGFVPDKDFDELGKGSSSRDATAAEDGREQQDYITLTWLLRQADARSAITSAKNLVEKISQPFTAEQTMGEGTTDQRDQVSDGAIATVPARAMAARYAKNWEERWRGALLNETLTQVSEVEEQSLKITTGVPPTATKDFYEGESSLYKFELKVNASLGEERYPLGEFISMRLQQHGFFIAQMQHRGPSLEESFFKLLREASD